MVYNAIKAWNYGKRSGGMDLRTLRYFLAVAREKTFTTAAQRLNLTQPTLSRQIRELEEELGSELLIRGKRKTTLTEAGQFLLARAQELLALEEKIRAAFAQPDSALCGEVSIACGESRAMSLVARAACRLRQNYPHVKFHLYSGNAESVATRLDSGLADFGVFISPVNLEKYQYFTLPVKDTWGLLLRKDSLLAKKQSVQPEDLAGLDLICSIQLMLYDQHAAWLGDLANNLNIVATYNLLYNAAIMVREGLGAALCIDGIADTSDSSPLCFRPLYPPVESSLDFAWKRGQQHSKAAAEFRAFIKQEIWKC